MKLTNSSFKLGVISFVFIFATINNSSYSKDNQVNNDSLACSNENDVIVSLVDYGKKKFVTGRIIIDKPPKLVWPILVNPFEYKEQINEHLKEVEVKLDRQDRSVLKCVLEYCFILPKISYVVESKYIPLSSVSFKSISGTLKDFEGLWQITPLNLSKETQVTFSMYIDPGIPIPAFIVRQGIRFELPNTLISLRNRIYSIYNDHSRMANQSIKAASVEDSMIGSLSGQILAHAKVK